MGKDFKRWLYHGNRPNRIARILNGFWLMIHSWGILPNMETLEVAGRNTGRVIALPIAVAHLNGERYLVSMLGSEAQWVQNVRAAKGKAYMRSGKRRAVHLEEVPDRERAPILKAYLKIAPGARPHIPVDKDAPLTAFEAVAADYPAFRIVPEA